MAEQRERMKPWRSLAELSADAPTERGLRHLQELEARCRQGDRAAVLFVLQRSDADTFSPHPTAHPEFAACLKQVHERGVEVYAWRCRVDLEQIELEEPMEVLL